MHRSRILLVALAAALAALIWFAARISTLQPEVELTLLPGDVGVDSTASLPEPDALAAPAAKIEASRKATVSAEAEEDQDVVTVDAAGSGFRPARAPRPVAIARGRVVDD